MCAAVRLVLKVSHGLGGLCGMSGACGCRRLTNFLTFLALAAAVSALVVVVVGSTVGLWSIFRVSCHGVCLAWWLCGGVLCRAALGVFGLCRLLPRLVLMASSDSLVSEG